jgi:hypothetical protein
MHCELGCGGRNGCSDDQTVRRHTSRISRSDVEWGREKHASAGDKTVRGISVISGAIVKCCAEREEEPTRSTTKASGGYCVGMSAYRPVEFLNPAPIIGCSVLGIATTTALRNHVAILEVADAYSRTATEGDLFLGDAYLGSGQWSSDDS